MAQFNPDAPFADEPTRPVGRPRKVVEPAAPARPTGMYDLTLFELMPTPEQTALREAAKVELNRRVQARREWALVLTVRGATLPDWMSTDAANDYGLNGAAITRRGGHYDNQLHRWVDVPDTGTDPFFGFNRALEEEVQRLAFGTTPDFRIRNGRIPDFAA